MLSGSHTGAKEVTSIDKIWTIFVGHMKSTTEHHQYALQGLVENVMPSTGSLIINTFKQHGWALPIRSNFRYSAKQKSLLYKYFIAGEESDKKMSPEQVHLLLRKDLKPNKCDKSANKKPFLQMQCTKETREVKSTRRI